MNRGELRTLTLSWLDDINAGYFTPDQVNVFLNNAQLKVQRRLIKASQNFYNKCVTTSLVVGQTDYVLPIDFMKLMRLNVWISGSGDQTTKVTLVPITTNQQDLLPLTRSTPQYYYFKKNRLVVLPSPDQIRTLEMLYAYQVAGMSADTDVPDVPDRYQELVALYAAEDGCIKDEQQNGLLMKRMADYEKMMDEDAQERNQDFSRSIRETGLHEYPGELAW